MASYKIISNNIVDKQSALNLLRSFVFGNEKIEEFDPNREYNTGDKAFITDKSTGKIKIIIAVKNGIKGPYNSANWNNYTFSDNVMNNLQRVVSISATEPSDKNIQVWVAPVRYTTHKLPETVSPTDGADAINVVFTMNGIPIVDDTSTSDLSDLSTGDVVFDYEGESTVSSSQTVTDFNTAPQLIIDEQKDLCVSDDHDKGHTDPAILWLDTDITDG